MSEQRISDEELEGIIEDTARCSARHIWNMAPDLRDLRDARAKLRELEAARGGAFDKEAAWAVALKRCQDDGKEGAARRQSFLEGAKWQSQQPAPSAPTATPGPKLEAIIDKALSVILSIIKEDGRGADFDLAGAIRNHLEHLLNRCGIPTRVPTPEPAPMSAPATRVIDRKRLADEIHSKVVEAGSRKVPVYEAGRYMAAANADLIADIFAGKYDLATDKTKQPVPVP